MRLLAVHWRQRDNGKIHHMNIGTYYTCTNTPSQIVLVVVLVDCYFV